MHLNRLCYSILSGERANVMYKMRDQFQFKVNGGLTITNVEFNAIDSIITPIEDTTLTKCL